MNKLRKLIWIIAVAFSILPLSKSLGQKKVSYDGYFELGGEAEYKAIYIESFYKIKLEYKIKINDYAKIQIDMRSNSEKRLLELYEGSAEFAIGKGVELKVGDLKKRYGLEEQTSREKLPFINESMINEYLEPLGFVSRDPGFQISWSDDDEKTILTGGLHYNESHRLTIMTLVKRKNFLGIDKVGAVFELARERDNDLSHTYIANINAAEDFGFVNCEFELFTGQDPIESYYRKLNCDGKMVNYFAASTMLTKKIPIGCECFDSIEPLILLQLLSKDIDQFDVNNIQLLAGLNIYFDEDIRFMINGNLIMSNHEYDKAKRTFYGSDASAQLQIRW